jgi:hypothetical protein
MDRGSYRRGPLRAIPALVSEARSCHLPEAGLPRGPVLRHLLQNGGEVHGHRKVASLTHARSRCALGRLITWPAFSSFALIPAKNRPCWRVAPARPARLERRIHFYPASGRNETDQTGTRTVPLAAPLTASPVANRLPSNRAIAHRLLGNAQRLLIRFAQA